MFKTIILPVVLYGCESWSLTLRDGHRQRVFENRVLRRVFGPKRDEMTGGWKKLYSDEIRKLCPYLSVIRVFKSMSRRWGWHVARMGEKAMHKCFERET
jgi:hypothetical protein